MTGDELMDIVRALRAASPDERDTVFSWFCPKCRSFVPPGPKCKCALRHRVISKWRQLTIDDAIK